MESIKGKTFFFDTNIYNHLFDFDALNRAAILRRIKEKGIIVCTVPQILGELAATYRLNPAKGQQLCQVYANFLHDDGVMYQPPELLLMELKTFLGVIENNELEEYAYKRGEDFGKALDKLMRGYFDEETGLFIQTVKTVKKQHLNHCRDSKKSSINRSARGGATSFNEIWNDEVQSGRLKEGIKGYLQKVKGQTQLSQLDIDQISSSIVSNIDHLPHLRAAGKIVPAMSYRYFFKNEKTKLGDLEDSANLIAVATLDGFVSDDEGALDIARLMFPEKAAVSLNDFLEFIGGAKSVNGEVMISKEAT